MCAFFLFPLGSPGNKESGKKIEGRKEQGKHKTQDETDIRSLLSSKKKSGIEVKEVDLETGGWSDAYKEPGKAKRAADTRTWRDTVIQQYSKKKKAAKIRKETKKNKPKKNTKVKKMSKKKKKTNERRDIGKGRKKTKKRGKKRTNSVRKEKKGNKNEKNTGGKTGTSKLRKLKARKKEKKEHNREIEEGSQKQSVAADCVMKIVLYARINDGKASVVSKQVVYKRDHLGGIYMIKSRYSYSYSLV